MVWPADNQLIGHLLIFFYFDETRVSWIISIKYTIQPKWNFISWIWNRPRTRGKIIFRTIIFKPPSSLMMIGELNSIIDTLVSCIERLSKMESMLSDTQVKSQYCRCWVTLNKAWFSKLGQRWIIFNGIMDTLKDLEWCGLI